MASDAGKIRRRMVKKLIQPCGLKKLKFFKGDEFIEGTGPNRYGCGGHGGTLGCS
jgi:hypothetical protein